MSFNEDLIFPVALDLRYRPAAPELKIMQFLSKADLQRLIRIQDKPCISIFMPTHRSFAEMEQDQIRFKNLLRQAAQSADKIHTNAGSSFDRLVEAEQLLQNDSFWRQTSDGLAVFLSPEHSLYYRLPVKFDEFVDVDSRFYIKPLLPLFSGDGRFYILALSQNEVRLLQCSRFSAVQIDLPKVAGGLKDTLGYDEESGTQLQFHTGAGAAGGNKKRPALFHGHAVDAEDDKEEIRQYFREVDRNLRETMLDETAPLLLAGVDYLLPLYRGVSDYKYLIDGGISGNPEDRQAEDLQAEGWKIVYPHFKKSQQAALARYRSSAGTGLTSCDLSQIVPAARHARVEVLFVALTEQKWGHFDINRNEVTFHDRVLTDSVDLLNLAAVETITHGGTVYALNSDELPEPESPAAALLRF
jgi:hypothetical protein